ncbi:hypothetical protein [Bacillus wiedmannii]|uniref:hypothetical protein n=1 Tax=Bacillus wiedmannii TaxID=1890302 RepID=UPI000BEF6C17|nr:hypothetical protein [Bacillus wiedmannii]PEI78326.1 hypothetical protein CN905_11955 [Bacillus wiedmannii]PHF24311.1 hypothetical protein COF84_00255 [Bacillus wiedmannii]
MKDLPDLIKIVPAILAVISGIYFMIQRVIKLSATDELDILFINKEERKKLAIIDSLIVGITSGFSIYVLPGYLFYSLVDIGFIKYFGLFIGIICFISMIIFFFISHKITNLIGQPVENTQESRKKLRNLSLGICLSSLSWYYIILFFTLSTSNWPEIVFVSFIVPCILTSFILIPMNKIRPRKKEFSIRILKENELSNLTLIHDYTIDEKRIFCINQEFPRDELFYVCDFSSKVYLEYKKVPMIIMPNSINEKRPNADSK